MNEQKNTPSVSPYENKDVPNNEDFFLNNNIEKEQEDLSLFTDNSLEMNGISKEENNVSYLDLPKEKEETLPLPEQSENVSLSVGFVPTGSFQKKKNSFIRLVIILILVLLIGLLGYFIVYPYIARTLFSNPKKVFESTIRGVSKEIISTLPEIHDKGIYDLSMALDSTILEFQKYTGYTYSAHFGFDSENLELAYGIKNKDKEYTQNFYLKDKTYYTKFSTNPEALLALGDDNPLETSSLFSFLTQLEKMKKEDLTYVVQFFSDAFIQSLEEEQLSREDSRITINEESFKVTRNLYTMDYQTKVNTIQTICDQVLADEKLLIILSSITSLEESIIKDKIIALKEEVKETDKEDTLLISIFTYGNKAEIIGFEITHGENQIHYYERKGNFEGYFCLTKIIDGEKNVTKITLLGEKKAKSTEVSLKVNDHDCLQLSETDFTKEKIAFSYTLHSDLLPFLEQDISGSFLYTKEINKDDQLQTILLSIDIENEKVKATLTLDSNFKNDLEAIPISTAVFKEKEEYNLLKKRFLNQVFASTPLSYFFSTLSGSYDQDIYK